MDVDPLSDQEQERLEATENSGLQPDSVCIRFDLEPMFLVIDYRDAAGRFSRRRVTTRWLEKRGKDCYVGAICHERRAHRKFRLDRIEGVIDADGIVEKASSFFDSIIADDEGYEVAKPARRTPQSVSRPTASAYTLLRREIKPALVILSAAARADDFLHIEEIDRMMLFTETEAEHLVEEGVIAECPDIDGFYKLGRLITRLRPTRDELYDALDTIATWPGDRTGRLMKSLVSVVEADGIIVRSEFDFVREISEWSEENSRNFQ